MVQRLFLSFFCCVLFGQSLSAQFIVTPGNQPPYTPINLLTNFMTGAGINILDVTYNGDTSAVGFFSDGSNVVGLERGIILTTGSASTSATLFGADGEGADFASSANTGGSVEPNLENIVLQTLNDVAIYTITFQSYNDSIRFRYVFASEEYPEYACSSYNDAFGFFLQGPGYPIPTNIALIPGTNLPVTINNIHPFNINYPNCNAVFSQYYNDNSNTNLPPTYDGVLDPFLAEAAVEPCGIYTMIIAIADVGDAAYDSGVFIEANSFGSTPFVTASFGPGSNVIPEPATGLPQSLTFSQIPSSLLPLTVSFAGDAQNGVDYELIDSIFTINSTDTIIQFTIQPVTDSLAETVESVIVKVTNAGCFIRTFDLYIADAGIIFKGPDTLQFTGGNVELGGGLISLPDSSWTFTNETDYSPTTSGVSSPVYVDAVLPSTLNNIDMIQSVCINIIHGWLDDLDVYLLAPDGKFLELTTDNGGNGDHYTGTCFSPAATESINKNLPNAPSSAAPFTGNFQPEGYWTDLLGGSINGEWKLLVTDDNTGFSGTLDDWSITFAGSGIGAFAYAWSTGETTETITVGQPGFYTVTISNNVSTFEKHYFVKPDCGFSAQSYTICHHDSIIINGVTYNQAHPGGYEIYPVGQGCDSLVQINVQVLPEIQTVLQVAICTGTTYTFGNLNLSVGGEYTQFLTALSGCDSTVILLLNVTPVSQYEFSASVCEGESYFFDNNALTSTGVYQDTLVSGNGCDSIVSLHLEVLPQITNSISATIEAGGSFEAGGVVFTEAGDYTLALLAANGCDSILMIHIDIISGVGQSGNDTFQVFILPNPAQEAVTIRWPREIRFAQVSICTTDQRLVTSADVSKGTDAVTLDVSAWASGMYIIRLSYPDGMIFRKLIKI